MCVYIDEGDGARAPVLTPNSKKMKRNLLTRHLQMIAIGGTIGTGLFLKSDSAWSGFRSCLQGAEKRPVHS